MTEQTKEQIVSEIVEESKAILSIFALLLINTTLIWYIVNYTMESVSYTHLRAHET